MSYILDALKKSEKERGRRKASRGGAEPIPETEKPPLANRWRYLIGAALLLNAGLLVWWLRPWQPGGTSNRTPEQIRDAQTQQAAKAAAPAQAPAPVPSVPQTASLPVPAVEPTVSAIPAASVPVPAAPAPSASGSVAQAPVAQAHDAPPKAAPSGSARPEAKGHIQTAKAPAPEDGGLSGAPVTRPAVAHPPVPPQAPSAKAYGPGRTASDDPAKTKQTTAKARAAYAAKRPEGIQQQGLGGSRELITDLKALTGAETQSDKAALSRKAIRYHELPSQVRDSMPRISVSMLLYSKKSDERWINVNGLKMREGQEVSAGLKVEEITPDGAVFTYHGHRFYKAVIGD